MKKDTYFWIGYGDLMTSLFFVTLILFVIGLAVIQQNENKIEEQNIKIEEITKKQKSEEKIVTDAKKLQEIETIQKALETLDENYFEYDDNNKRYRLAVDAIFKSASPDINDINEDQQNQLRRAGIELYSTIKEVIHKNNNIDYLLVIEGNTQRKNMNWERIPDGGYKLSYKRALALRNFWKENEIDFSDFGDHCEVIIAGSGYFGLSRDTINEEKNRNFTIQITAKVGKFIGQ